MKTFIVIFVLVAGIVAGLCIQAPWLVCVGGISACALAMTSHPEAVPSPPRRVRRAVALAKPKHP